jgi:hypothetical protein
MMENKWEDCSERHSENMDTKVLPQIVGIIDPHFGRRKIVVF